MTEFFDKLRKDRQQAESRNLCNEVTGEAAKDALRIQLSLYYAGVEEHAKVAQSIVQTCFGIKTPANNTPEGIRQPADGLPKPSA